MLPFNKYLSSENLNFSVNLSSTSERDRYKSSKSCQRVYELAPNLDILSLLRLLKKHSFEDI